MDEYFDLVDRERRSLNRIHRRGTPLEAGTYHNVVSVWTMNRDGRVLLTLRSANRPLMPNLWENTSGWVLTGESSVEAALRELEEETGIEATPEQTTLLGTLLKMQSFVDVYLVRVDIDPKSIRLQKEEAISYRWEDEAGLQVLHEEQLLAFPIAFEFEPFRTALRQAAL
ncbi:MAG TPA: NUDIX domain-containing protein [Sphaerochaeta sp.]|nr:NUDIX domain-containing protein [Spirochaetota bacterium]NLL25408.1 NUDIX domain-containing protein [Spirochaetales bacterium]HOE89162.1 NUDIX domain-containing protein [Sphaerochaeta sp.]HOR79829.1 NUDIX domain-containing protein [Sphaerochaeta sp.]HPK63578.1 NUDIX domain-containing protein [Sphaerochaeta sp.]